MNSSIAPALDELLSTLPKPVARAAEIISITHATDDETARDLVERFTSANGSSTATVATVKGLPFVSPSDHHTWKISSPVRQVLADRCYQHDLGQEVDRYLADRLRAKAGELPATSPSARQLQWRSIYHLLPVDARHAFSELDGFMDNAATGDRLSDLKAAVKLTDLRQRWLGAYQVETAFVRGRSAYAFQEFAVAERNFKIVWESDTDAHRRIIAGHLLGVIWSRKAREDSWTKAEKVLSAAANLARETEDRFGEGVILTTLGTIQLRLAGGDAIRSAEKALRRSAEIFEGKNGRREGLALGALGAVLFQKGSRADLMEAERVLRRGLNLLPPESHGTIEDRLARVLGRLGGEKNIQEAERLVQKRLREGSDPLDTAITLNMLAQTLMRRGDRASLSKAREAADQSIQLGRDLGNQRHLAMALLSLSWIAEKSGDREKALTTMEEVVAINESLGFEQHVRKGRKRLEEIRRRASGH